MQALTVILWFVVVIAVTVVMGSDATVHTLALAVLTVAVAHRAAVLFAAIQGMILGHQVTDAVSILIHKLAIAVAILAALSIGTLIFIAHTVGTPSPLPLLGLYHAVLPIPVTWPLGQHSARKDARYQSYHDQHTRKSKPLFHLNIYPF